MYFVFSVIICLTIVSTINHLKVILIFFFYNNFLHENNILTKKLYTKNHKNHVVIHNMVKFSNNPPILLMGILLEINILILCTKILYSFFFYLYVHILVDRSSFVAAESIEISGIHLLQEKKQ